MLGLSPNRAIKYDKYKFSEGKFESKYEFDEIKFYNYYYLWLM